MNRNKHIVFRFFKSPLESKLKSVLICFFLVKVQIIVWLVPLRYYYHMYFSQAERSISDKQLFVSHMSRFNRIRKLLPFKFSCLVESMALYDYLKRYGLINPVRIGIRIKGNMDAHAWNDHQSNSDFKTII